MPGNRLSEVHLQPKFAGVGADFGPAGKLSNFPDYPATAGRDGNRRSGTGEARNKRRKSFFRFPRPIYKRANCAVDEVVFR